MGARDEAILLVRFKDGEKKFLPVLPWDHMFASDLSGRCEVMYVIFDCGSNGCMECIESPHIYQNGRFS